MEEVPSLQRLREKHKELAKSGIKRHLFNIGGETLYVNDPCDIIANDWANPTVTSRMQLYAEDNAQNQKSEAWHGTRWSEFPEFLSRWSSIRTIPKSSFSSVKSAGKALESSLCRHTGSATGRGSCSQRLGQSTV